MKKVEHITVDEFLKREKSLKYKIRNYYKYKVKKHTGKYRLFYVAIILVVASSFLLLFEKTKDFGLNLTTEMVGLLITVVIIDKLYESKEKRKNLKINIRIFSEINSFIYTYLSIWKHIKVNFNNELNINNLDDLIANYKTLIINTDIHSKFDVIQLSAPENTSVNFFIGMDVKESLILFKEYAELIISHITKEYNIYLEPDLYDLLKAIQSDNLFESEISSLKNVEQTTSIILTIAKRKVTKEQTTKLNFFLNEHNTLHLYKLNRLINFNNKFYKELNKFDYEIDSYPYDFEKQFTRFEPPKETNS